VDLTHLEGWWRLIAHEPANCAELIECDKDLMVMKHNPDEYLTP